VSTAYTPADWTDFGTAVATAAAALVGLLFVAISINLRTILEEKGLPSRAAQTLILFGTALIVAVLLVIPGQGHVATGLELVASGLVILGVQLYLDLTTERGDEETFWRRLVGRVFPSVVSCGCIVIAGVTLLAQAGGGLYWVVPATVTAILFGLTNTWVLLVEILR
jgi:hypothetical protein